MDLEKIETKLAAARTRLILERPFLGALVLRLPMVVADPKWCRTTATDARRFFYNAQYIQALHPDEAQFVLAHEALHCALSHFNRRQHRLKHRWDLACDYAINPLLINDGLVPPPGVLVMDQFEGMSAEQIYPCLDEQDDEQDTLDQHVYDADQAEGGRQQPQNRGQGGAAPQSGGGQGQPRPSQPETDPSGGAQQPAPLSNDQREALGVQWQQRLAGAAQQAMQAGKLGGAMARVVDFLLQPQLPWRMLLARYMTAVARDDYDYSRPSSRRGDPAIFPSLRSAQVNLMVALDISGSISAQEMSEFISEIDAVKGQMRARITLLACDTGLSKEGPWYYEPWEDFELPRRFSGGGGTRFTPVFEWTDRQDMAPDLLLYFTDAQGEFPPKPPVYPVIWLVKGKAKTPWGQRIQLN